MKDLYKSIEGEEVRLADLDDKKWAQLNQKAVSTIRSDRSKLYYHGAKKSRVNAF